MDRRDLDNAIYELDTLLKLENTQEKHFQTWLENNLVVFHILGYVQIEPHPIFSTPDGMEFIPDFLAQTQQGLWEVVEIKKPNCRLYSNKNRRNKFYESMSGYISQCREYSDWLSQNPGKQQFEEKFGPLNRHPSSLLIAGQNSDFNRIGAHEDLAGKTPHTRIITYDDLMNLLIDSRNRIYGQTDNATGVAFFLAARLYPSDKESVFLDIGDNPNINRITLGALERNQLFIRTIDSMGSINQSFVQEEDTTFRFGQIIIIYFETAKTDIFTRTSIEINHRAIWEAQHKQGEIAITTPVTLTVGSNMLGEHKSKVDVMSHVFIPKPISPQHSRIISDYLALIASNEEPNYLEFTGNSFMYTEGHPIIDAHGSTRSTNLVQPKDEFKPILRKYHKQK